MPELPDITIYLEALEKRILNRKLEKLRITNPFLLRTATPSISSIQGLEIVALRRMGKRIVFGFENNLWLVLHLMIAGRLHWHERDVSLSGKQNLAGFTFANGTLTLTEAGSKRRASLYLLEGETELQSLDPGGLEVMGCSPDAFAQALTVRNHTLKRALTDPRLLSGIGNAYSDEILHRAGLSPMTLTQKLSGEQIKVFHEATQAVLTEWVTLLRKETGEQFPERVTAFRTEMAVHGKFGKPCPVCGTKIQRIRHAANETNYCPNCQTGGKLLADRSLSLLLKKDWPKTVEELEELRAGSGKVKT
jgi:formamidopyrimidine-DNA glycosylase